MDPEPEAAPAEAPASAAPPPAALPPKPAGPGRWAHWSVLLDWRRNKANYLLAAAFVCGLVLFGQKLLSVRERLKAAQSETTHNPFARPR